MRIEAIMVGDLLRVNRDGLCIKKDTIVQIRGIDGDNKFEEKGLVGCAGCQPLDETQISGGIWLDYLSPIPLTPENLENNGFKKKHPTQHFCEIVIGSFRITVQFGYGNNIDYVRIYETPNDNYIPETNINIYHPKIKYVHELQHALKLCGIDKEIVL